MVEPFLLEEMQSDIFFPEPLPVNESAFVRFIRPIEGFPSENSISISNRRNMNKRMIEFLRTIPRTTIENRDQPENNLSYRHMMNERLRRKNQKQSYEALRSMMHPGTKKDKISIIQMAALHVKELQLLKEKLQRRNHELEANIAAKECEKVEVAKIRLRMVHPSSAIDSMTGVLECLKNMKLKARMIQSEFSAQEFSAVLEVESLIEAAEVEKAVHRALMEVERRTEHSS
ncbi:hypothetical protein HHK36_022616 [Tetracentron sinense]|uniref:BHLH domain-containing protein n=1 Tax=Tetracentron sinense TaxID=13715 RepID=A0A834YN59_TETSI|nr:hypothetical protein HHK36_022616 [Tetracentron sinense]